MFSAVLPSALRGSGPISAAPRVPRSRCEGEHRAPGTRTCGVLLPCAGSRTRRPRRGSCHPPGVDPWPSADVTVAEASTPPSSWYTSRAVLEAEEERVLWRSWQAVGRADQVLRTRFVVVRGEDGELRCFHNVCRHHAMSVASGSGNILDHDPSDKSREGCFTCPYHGWTYDTSGCLVKATRLTGIQGFSPAKYGLRPMRAMVWGHFVWVHLGAGGDEVLPGVGEWLGEVAAELEAGGAADPSLRFVERRNYLLRCNWKVFCDNYLDGGYHVPFAHPGLSSCVDMKSYSTDLFPGGHSVQSVRSDGSVSQPDLRLGSAACYGFVYPNFMVNRYGPWMDTNWAVPLGPDRCLVVFDYYLEEAMLEDSAFIKESLAASDAIQQEDTTLCHGVQEGVSSPGYGAGRYAPSVEAAMFHFHQSLHSDLVIRGS